MGSIYQYLSRWFRFGANACLVHMKIIRFFIHLLNIFSFSVNIGVKVFFFSLICVCMKNWRRQNTKRLYFVWCPRKNESVSWTSCKMFIAWLEWGYEKLSSKPLMWSSTDFVAKLAFVWDFPLLWLFSIACIKIPHSFFTIF